MNFVHKKTKTKHEKLEQREIKEHLTCTKGEALIFLDTKSKFYFSNEFFKVGLACF